jgi:hypothetical protein
MSKVRAEVVYALPQRQTVVAVELAQGATVYQAVMASGIGRDYPELDVDKADFGIWGERVDADDRVSDGDRIEIYRPLVADPKTMRRKRANRGQSEMRRRKT